MLVQHPASYKDPAGYVVTDMVHIYRVITKIGAASFHEVRQTPAISQLIEKQWILPEKQIFAPHVFQHYPDAAIVLEHPPLPFISYPYEWTFSGLQQAALKHLQIQQYLLAEDIVLVDASAYNMQFLGTAPVFIDHLSFKPYQAGQYWLAHQQFCEEFLNPLLLTAYCSVDFQPFYRGAMNGISSKYLAKLLPWHKKISINTLLNVVLPDYFDQKSRKIAVSMTQKRPFSKSAYQRLLCSLEKWIGGLSFSQKKSTAFSDYAIENSYDEAAKQAKQKFIQQFVKSVCPTQIIDMGCNSGDYAITALKAGARMVIGLDTDSGALEKAYAKAVAGKYNFIPLYGDFTNLSPGQGLGGQEKQSFEKRIHADAIFVLAFMHHLAFNHNLSLKQIVDNCLTKARAGILEFVPKTDPMAMMMLSLKGDIYEAYTYENLLAILSAKAHIVMTQKITPTGRTLIWYEKK